jgi:hypothetical protein
VRARAEALPIASGAFDAGLAIVAIHHWADWRRGFDELRRVAHRRIVVLTWDPESDGFWLVRDCFPRFLEEDRRRFPDRRALESVLGPLDVPPVPIPHDCRDGFMGAYWRRPKAYLDPAVRASISTFADGASAAALATLADDLASGRWHRKHAALLARDEVDIGYRLVVASVA